MKPAGTTRREVLVSIFLRVNQSASPLGTTMANGTTFLAVSGLAFLGGAGGGALASSSGGFASAKKPG